MNRIVWIAGLGAMAALTAGCQDQDKDRVSKDTTITGPSAQTGIGADADFMRKASMTNQAEIELGQMAQQRGGHPDVQRYGAMLAKDHGDSQQQLEQIANQQKVTLSKQLDAEHQKVANRLSKLQGQDFDRAFIDEMVSGHQKAIAMFEEQMRSGQNPQTKSFAANTLPHLRHHLDFAKEIQSRMSGGAAPSGNMPPSHNMQPNTMPPSTPPQNPGGSAPR
jgi:putative membrane protein